MILRIRDADGNVQEILCIRGEPGERGPQGAMGADGKDGNPGKDGADGYTPVRGTDYWTPDDIAEIKAYVDEAILGGAW